jgi:hypothetical protein
MPPPLARLRPDRHHHSICTSAEHKRSKQYFHKTECLLSSGLRDSRTLKRCKQACCGACALTSAHDGFVISEDFSPPRPVHTSSSFSHSVGHGYQGHSVRCGCCTGPQKNYPLYYLYVGEYNILSHQDRSVCWPAPARCLGLVVMPSWSPLPSPSHITDFALLDTVAAIMTSSPPASVQLPSSILPARPSPIFMNKVSPSFITDCCALGRGFNIQPRVVVYVHCCACLIGITL